MSEVEKVRYDLHKLEMKYYEVKNMILRAHRNIEAVSSILKNCGIDEKVVQDMSNILSQEAEMIEIQLGEMGIRRFGVYGNIMTDCPGWFQTNAPFTVIEPAWIYDKDGECYLIKQGIGLHVDESKGV
jgi:hypothetical protein